MTIITFFEMGMDNGEFRKRALFSMNLPSAPSLKEGELLMLSDSEEAVIEQYSKPEPKFTHRVKQVTHAFASTEKGNIHVMAVIVTPVDSKREGGDFEITFI